jgi:hypothetical protein
MYMCQALSEPLTRSVTVAVTHNVYILVTEPVEPFGSMTATSNQGTSTA